MSKLSNENNKEEFIKSVSQSINTIILLIIPISVGAIVLANPIVKIVFERGAFNSDATSMTAIALACYSVGMIGFGLREILNKVFYSLQDTKTPMINGILAMSMNIVLSIVFIKVIGFAGIALATSISALICIVLLFRSLKKKMEYFGKDKIIKTTIKSFISAIVMGVATYFIYNIVSNLLGTGFVKEAISLFVSIGIGAITYGIMVISLKVDEINILIDIVKKRLKKMA